MKLLLTLTLLVTFATTLLAHNDRDKRKLTATTCADCTTVAVAPCADCDTAEPAACTDCAATTPTPCTDCAPAAAPAQAMTRKAARDQWQAMSKEERRHAKGKLRQLLAASPIGMASATLGAKLQQLKQHGNNTADAQMMMMDDLARILIIVALVLLCLILLGILL
jgi:hypothetical protein